MNVLVLGGAGFLGTNLVRRCVRESARVTVVDSLEPRLGSSVQGLREVWSSIEFLQRDARDDSILREVLPGQDVVFNCAAQASHILSMSEPELDLELNCLLSLRLLEAARAVNRSAVYCYPSTSTVVGRSPDRAVDERSGERPLDIHSTHKLTAEHYYRIYGAVHGLPTVVLRFANLYGPYGKDRAEFGFVNYFISLAWAGRDLPVFGDGAQRRNVMFVEDAVDLMFRAATDHRLRGRALLAAHHEHFSVREIAKRIVSVFGRGRVVRAPWPADRRNIEVEDVRIASTELLALTAWSPRHSFDDGLRITREALAAV